MRFVGLALQDAVPDANTIWLRCEPLARAGALAGLFARFDAMLTERGLLAMGGQIVGAAVVEGPALAADEEREGEAARGRHARRLVEGPHAAD